MWPLDTAKLYLQYWDNPGAFNQAGLEPTKPHLDRFLAIIYSIVQAAFGFSGIEIVSLSWEPSFSRCQLLNDIAALGRSVRAFFWRPLIHRIPATDSPGFT